MNRLLYAFLALAGLPLALSHAAEPATYDVVIYGGTSAGVAAAVQTSRMGKTVVLIEPGQHLGGLTVSGLGQTDSGNKAVIGGVSREFYQRIKQHYDNDSAWRQERQADNASYQKSTDAMWTFEPHVAEDVFKRMLAETKAVIVKGESLDRKAGVKIREGRIASITMKSGKEFRGSCFIDATYEGDLMAAAGVTYTVGREANSQYNETLDGVQIGHSIHHQFVKPVDPYVRAGEPASGLLPGINTKPGTDGEADHRVQAYNYRICMTDAKENQVPFEKPENFDPQWQELLLRNFEAGDMRVPLSIGKMPNRKTDLNNNFAVSTDWIGMNYEYPDADDETRKKILKDHENYVRGFLWTLANNPRVPEEIRKQAGRWGYSKDEFQDNHHWPYWCYIREARRMVSDYVQTELDCRRVRQCEDSVGLGSYNMDSHNCQRYVDEHGHVRNEGDVQVSPRGPYLISYRAIIPRKEECTNLLVPVCLSSSHISYGSIRMEPVFMILGQSAATAACLAIDKQQPVQAVDYQQLRAVLLKDHQVLDLPAGAVPHQEVHANQLPGVVVDDTQAQKQGEWATGSTLSGFVGTSYLHDDNAQKGEKSITYQLKAPHAGKYSVRMSYSAHSNRAKSVPVTVTHSGKSQVVQVNEQKAPPIDHLFIELAELELMEGEAVTVMISNKETKGHVIADAVQLLPKK